MAADFSAYENAFPPASTVPVDPVQLADIISSKFRVRVPDLLFDFWGRYGAGYFGENELFFFKGSTEVGDDKLFHWNSQSVWREIFPQPLEGGPVFFAETCFGEQIGFRWDGASCIFVLFSLDLFELFVLSESSVELFCGILGDRKSIFDEQVLEGVKARLGRVQNGMHYVPIVSPLVGGSSNPKNFILGPRRVHIVDSMILFRSLQLDFDTPGRV